VDDDHLDLARGDDGGPVPFVAHDLVAADLGAGLEHGRPSVCAAHGRLAADDGDQLAGDVAGAGERPAPG
jgi:hypothetical protein